MKISIILPTFNSEKIILKNLESIKSQIYKNYEIIVIDNCSSDETINLIKKFKFENIKFIIEKDDGIYDAFNKGISIASGDVISHLNSDDYYASEKTLTHIVENFSDNLDAVYGNISYVSNDERSKEVRYWKSNEFFKGSFLKGWSPPHTGFFFRKKLFDLFGNYNTKLGTPADIIFMYNLLEINNINSKFIDQDLVKMRVGGKSNQSLKQVCKQNFVLARHFRLFRRPHLLVRFVFFKLINRLKQYFNKSHL